MTMMTARDIDSAAADWAARLDRGELTAEEDHALTRWMEADSRHRGAFMRMRAIALHTERARALGPAFDPDALSSVPARRARRGWLKAGALAAAACAAGILLLPFIGGADRYETQRGELRVVSLDDGTVMTLNTASRVEVAYSDGRRDIRLLEGEALFDVARDPARPFVVTSGAIAVRALGTSFTTRRLGAAPLHVLVREGLVQLEEETLPAPVQVAARMQAEVTAGAPPGVRLATLSPEDIAQQLAWREGRIAFTGETLAEAARTFTRYSHTPLVIDSQVADQQITGLFAANDPASFARAAAQTLGLRMQVHAGAVHITP